MNFLISSLLVVSVFIFVSCGSSFSNLEQNLDCTNNICLATGNLTVRADAECTFYTYNRNFAKSPEAALPDELAKCTQKTCTSSDEAIIVDCVKAFGQDSIDTIERKTN